jgi:hypothetical protein
MKSRAKFASVIAPLVSPGISQTSGCSANSMPVIPAVLVLHRAARSPPQLNSATWIKRNACNWHIASIPGLSVRAAIGGNRTTLRNWEDSRPRGVVQNRRPSQVYRLERVAGCGIIVPRRTPIFIDRGAPLRYGSVADIAGYLKSAANRGSHPAKIMPAPSTARTAPSQAVNGGGSPRMIHIIGSITTGAIELRTATIPAS